MKKRLIIVGALCLMAGGIVGGVVGTLYTTRLFASGMRLLKQGEVHKAQDSAWRAYVSGNYQVAQWGITEGLAAIANARSCGYPDINELNQLEFEAQARLALLAKTGGTQDAYSMHMASAKKLATQNPYRLFSSLKTDEQITEFIIKMDVEKSRNDRTTGPTVPPEAGASGVQ